VNDQSILNSLCFEKKHFHNVPLVKSEYLVYKVDRIWKRNINFRKAINIAPGIVGRCQRQIKSTLQVSKVISICGLLARTKSISSIQGGVGCWVLRSSGLGRALFLTRYWPQTTGQSGVRHATLGLLYTDLSLLYSCRVNHPYLCSNMKTFWYDNRPAFLLWHYLNSNIINYHGSPPLLTAVSNLHSCVIIVPEGLITIIRIHNYRNNCYRCLCKFSKIWPFVNYIHIFSFLS